MISLFGEVVDRLVGLARGPKHAAESPPASVDEVAFRNALAGGVHGVSIVTTEGPGGRAGITVSSLVSASVTPPLVLVCIHHRAKALAAIVRNGTFAVNLLAVQHRPLAEVFAGRPARGAPHDFSRAAWIAGATGSPVLGDALASLDCVLERVIRIGTHRALLGRCVGVRATGGPALLYTDRRYGIPLTWSPEVRATRSTRPQRRGGNIA